MVYMLLGTGFEETEAIAPLDLLRRAGVEALTVGVNGKTVYGAHNIGVEADITVGEMDLRKNPRTSKTIIIKSDRVARYSATVYSFPFCSASSRICRSSAISVFVNDF